VDPTKVPLDLGPKLIFRLGVPGFIIGIATTPLVIAFAHSVKVEPDKLGVIAISTVLWGWIICLSDRPIYMLYEGRCFWPTALREWGINHENRRLRLLKANATDEIFQQNRVLFMESAIGLLNFPLNKEGEPEAHFPTRLGNLIAAYESYTHIKFGLDAIFYWPRLWVVLDKDLRDEVENQRGLADSAVYISFALSITAVTLTGYAIANGFFHSRLANVPQPMGLFLLACGLCAASYSVYCLSLFAHAQFGELYKAIFDQHHKKLAIDDLVEKVGTLAGDLDASKRPEAERYMMVSRYLRWHRIRPLSESSNYTPEAWRAELKRRECRDDGDPDCA
jgi:hypothetical protein